MTPDGDNERDPRLRGRRSGDRWTRRRIIEIGTIVGLLWGGYSAISAYFGAKWATHTEVGQVVVKVDSLRSNMDSVRVQGNRRFQEMEVKQAELEGVHQLLPAFFRMQCITLERDNSKSLAEVAGFPCDSLLRRRR